MFYNLLNSCFLLIRINGSKADFTENKKTACQVSCTCGFLNFVLKAPYFLVLIFTTSPPINSPWKGVIRV